MAFYILKLALPLLCGTLSAVLSTLPAAGSSSTFDQFLMQEQKCAVPTTAEKNETKEREEATFEQYFCAANDYDPEVDELITESSYTPPLNHTYPAPKTAEGLGLDLGEPQSLDPTYSEHIFARIEKSREYMQSKVMAEDKYSEVRSICKNQHSNCAFWSVIGECENNPGYMHVNCAPVCETCEVSRCHAARK